MNVNSQNQWWSLWKFHASYDGPAITSKTVKANILRFARKMFGSVGAMRFNSSPGTLDVQVLVENAAGVAHDPAYCDYVKTQWTAFLVNGFGASTTVSMESKLMAGSRQNGTPSDQMMIMPGLSIH